MKRFSWLFILMTFVLSAGCSKNPTSAKGSNGWDEVGNAPWTARYGLFGTVFNNNMWVAGGASGSGGVTNYYSDVWSTSDGKSWNRTAVNPFGGRYEGQMLSFNNQLFVIGGNVNGTLKNDVWSSPDGITWTNILAANLFITSSVVGGTQFCPREDFAAVVFNGLMWVIGGTNTVAGTNGLNDVWSSPDGITWTQMLPNNAGITPASAIAAGQFTGRWAHSAAVFNGNMYVIAGHTTGTGNNDLAVDVWFSNNGSVWASTGKDFGPDYYHQTVVNNAELWTTCGYNGWAGGAMALAAHSPDGINWTTSGEMPFPARFGHLSLSFNNQVWIMGGCDNKGSLIYYRDVWHGP